MQCDTHRDPAVPYSAYHAWRVRHLNIAGWGSWAGAAFDYLSLTREDSTPVSIEGHQ